MKKFLSMLLCLMMCGSLASADDIDLSGMSFAELVALKDKINLAIWSSQEWQEVIVPEGVWKVGEDIPVGHWVITALGANTGVTYCSKLDASGKDMDYRGEICYSRIIHNPDSVLHFDPNFHASFVEIDAKEGTYIIIEGRVTFTPYAGKPDLGFE